jgi:glycosyltransferase involved in cell wall biosynthesis
MPTYRRPTLLKRAIRCLQAQTLEEWICEVRDDCPDASARAVVEELRDSRVRYVHNRPQKFGVRNLDDCFSLENPFQADYFFMLEDDNQVRPEFMALGQEIIEQGGVKLCQINQAVEFLEETNNHSISAFGIFDDVFDERVYQPAELHLAIMGAIGTSNGSLFWSRKIRHEFALGMNTIPALDEYLRTILITEPIYISRAKLAVWAKSEQATLRNLGVGKNWLRRELDLKASIAGLQRAIWQRTPPELRRAFLAGGVLRIPLEARLHALSKAGVRAEGAAMSLSPKARAKRMAVRQFGREHPSVAACVGRSWQQSKDMEPATAEA